MENDTFNNLKAEEIVSSLEEPVEDRRPIISRLRKEARVKELVKALEQSHSELTRCILCDILGERKAKTAVLAILKCLDDPSSDLKDSAAEALGKIGSLVAGESLLTHIIADPRTWYAIALGAIDYRPSIPYPIGALLSNYSGVRRGAAWSLGEMRVAEARDQLEKALAVETGKYASKCILDALEQIKGKQIDLQTEIPLIRVKADWIVFSQGDHYLSAQ